MNEHTSRFAKGFGILGLFVLTIGVSIALAHLLILAVQYWHWTRWGMLALEVAFLAYVIGWLLE